MADAHGNQTNATDYAYNNPVPGTVAVGSRAIDSKTETTHQAENAGYGSATPQSGQAMSPTQEAGVGPSDTSNPVASENARNHGL